MGALSIYNSTTSHEYDYNSYYCHDMIFIYLLDLTLGKYIGWQLEYPSKTALLVTRVICQRDESEQPIWYEPGIYSPNKF